METKSIVVNKMKTVSTEEGFVLKEATGSISSPMMPKEDIDSRLDSQVSTPPLNLFGSNKARSTELELSEKQRVIVEELKSIQSSEDGY